MWIGESMVLVLKINLLVACMILYLVVFVSYSCMHVSVLWFITRAICIDAEIYCGTVPTTPLKQRAIGTVAEHTPKIHIPDDIYLSTNGVTSHKQEENGHEKKEIEQEGGFHKNPMLKNRTYLMT